MRSNSNPVWFYSVLFVIAAFVALFGFMLATGSRSEQDNCTARWSRSGLKSEWNSASGCMLQIKDGAWVPERFVRITP